MFLSTVSMSGTPIVSKWHLASHLLSTMIGTVYWDKVLRCMEDGQACGNELMMRSVGDQLRCKQIGWKQMV